MAVITHNYCQSVGTEACRGPWPYGLNMVICGYLVVTPWYPSGRCTLLHVLGLYVAAGTKLMVQRTASMTLHGAGTDREG